MAATKLPTNYAEWWGSATNWNNNPAWKAAGAPNQFATKNALYDAANKSYQTYNNKDLSSTFDANTGSGASWMSNKSLSDLLTSDGYGRYYDTKSKAWMKSQSRPDGTYSWTADNAFGQKLDDYIGQNALASSSKVYSVGADAGKNYYRLSDSDALGQTLRGKLTESYGDAAKNINLDSYLYKNYSQDELAKMHAAGGIDKFILNSAVEANKGTLGTARTPLFGTGGAANTLPTGITGLITPGAGSAPATASAPQLKEAQLAGEAAQMAGTTGQIDQTKMAQFNPQTYTINESKDTVQGQLAGLLSSDNPILQRARTKALQGMNERGLLNSSMAQQASDEAWYSAALPIAGEDAKANLTNSQQNVQYQNQAGQFNADYANKAIFGNADAAMKVGSANLDTKTKIDLANLDSRQKTALANLDSATKTGLANIESNYRQLMQANQSVSEYYKQTVKNIADIQSNPDLPEHWKRSAAEDQTAMLRSYLSITGSMTNLNLSSLLDFSGMNYVMASKAEAAAPPPPPPPAPAPVAQSPETATDFDTYKARGGIMDYTQWMNSRPGLIDSHVGS